MTEDLKGLLSRREFNGLCAASLSLSLTGASAMIDVVSGASAQAAGIGAASAIVGPGVKFPDGTIVSALGQGSWHLAQGRHPENDEEEALRTGLSLGMSLIDTAEIYGDGRSEELISHVIAGQRDRVFLVSKVMPDHTKRDGITRACEATLARLGTDYLDLYLLHWRSRDTDLSGVVAAFESLRERGKIRAWGVSNFKISDMEELFDVPDGHRCATNQILYNLANRRFELDLLPWCEQHSMPVMAYSPLGGSALVRDATLARIAVEHDCSATAIALAWAIRAGNIIAIPESGSKMHVKENAVALSLTLTPQELQILDAAYPVGSGDVLRSLLDRSKRWVRSFRNAL
jgi:diketogulonate reductase-like aldo/keto reductase